MTGGNRNDVTQFEAIPPNRGKRDLRRRRAPRPGRPRLRPDKYCKILHVKGIRTHIARRGTTHGSGLGATRYVVEQTITLLHWFRRLRLRWERHADNA